MISNENIWCKSIWTIIRFIIERTRVDSFLCLLYGVHMRVELCIVMCHASKYAAVAAAYAHSIINRIKSCIHKSLVILNM